MMLVVDNDSTICSSLKVLLKFRLHLNMCDTAPMVDIGTSLFEQVIVIILKNS